ncbi:MAG: hypothetical protein HY927_15190 [Elusimicrobia bacterium]|nr:hypothetical protein [Elusimicrobiota bacterium]
MSRPTMVDPERAYHAVCQCVEEINRQLPPERRLALSPEAILVGEGGTLDSLSIVSLLVAVEERMADLFGVRCSLLDEGLSADGESPLRTLGGLASWLAGRPRRGGPDVLRTPPPARAEAEPGRPLPP